MTATTDSPAFSQLAPVQSLQYRRDRLGIGTADFEISEAPTLARDLQLSDDLLDGADRDVGRVQDVVFANLIDVGQNSGEAGPVVQQLTGRRASILGKPHVTEGHVQLDLVESLAGRLLDA